MRIYALLILFSVSALAQPLTLQDPGFGEKNSSLYKNLIGYWRLEEASGVRYDTFGANHLTANGSPSQVTGKVGFGVGMTTTSQSCSIADNAALSLATASPGTSWSLCAWASRTTASGPMPLVWKGVTYSQQWTREYAIDWTGNWTAWLGNNTTFVNVTTPGSAINVWDFIVAWYDSTNKTVWIQVNNGTPAGKSWAFGTQNTAGAFYIGGSQTTTSFAGSIDEVGFWKGRTLTAEERATLYNLGSGTTWPRFNSKARNVFSAGSGSSGRTYINQSIKTRLIGPSHITSFIADVYEGGPASGWKLKLFRPIPAGSSYSFVSESDVLTATQANQSFSLATPLDAWEGDVVGLWIKGDSSLPAKVAGWGYPSSPVTRYETGDISTDNTFANNSASGYAIKVTPEQSTPTLIYAGDSIMAGSNGTTNWLPFLDASGPSGNVTNSIPAWLFVHGGVTNHYLNCGIGARTWSSLITDEIPTMIQKTPTTGAKWIIHCGVNDIATSRTWASVQTDMNTVKALLPANVTLYVDEILPDSNFNDTLAGNIRTFNTNYATWCSANGATLILCHDDMGQTRVSTGQLDDLKTAYNKDGVHLTYSGMTNLARIIKSAIAP